MTDVQVYPRHATSIGLCVSGQKVWMATNGFDWRTWIKEGYPSSVLEATGDAFALRTVAKAREEAQNGR